MCISLNPVEFSKTVIADFPASPLGEQRRVLSYMNTVSSAGADPNAMIFPVYGEVRGVMECPDPRASRSWLARQRGVYEESWEDESVTRGGGARSQAVQVAGNYLVSIATSVEDIPAVLNRLKRAAPFPGHVPEASDALLASMDHFYCMQALGIPQFVVAAFALPPHYTDDKNPVTITYTQSDQLAGRVVFPALDYHGEGEFLPYVGRSHRLLLSTNALHDIFRSAMTKSADTTPQEFGGAPPQFPIGIHDTRGLRRGLDAMAPNNDYIFGLETVHAQLQQMQSEITGLPDVDASDSAARYMRACQIARIVVGSIGRYGILGHSNQPATTAQEFAASGYGDALVVGGLLQDEI